MSDSPGSKRPLNRYFELLERRYGATGWWPGESPFEIAVGAILVQNTAWANVERAIVGLREAALLDPRALLRAPLDVVEETVRPSGFFRIKTKRLLAFCAFLVEHFDGNMERLGGVAPMELRKRLLEIHGIGPETADDILLYACGTPVFVVDAYTRRVLARHGLIAKDVTYAAMQSYCEEQLPRDTAVYGEMHALLVMVAKDYCRTKPRCEACPLASMLPAGGPLA